MTDISAAEQSRVYTDKAIAIQTGQGIARSKHWIVETLAPGVDMNHIVLSNTANTAAVGELNLKHGLGFTWPEKLPSKASASTPCAIATVKGCIHHKGKFKIMPMRLSENTPERADSDPVLILELDHCSSPDCSCGKPRLQDLLESLVETDEVTHALTSQCTNGTTSVEQSSAEDILMPDAEIAHYIIGGSNSDESMSASQLLALELRTGLPLRRLRQKTTKPEGDTYEHPHAESNSSTAWDLHRRFHFSDDLSSKCPVCRAGLQRRKAAKRESGGNNSQVLKKAGSFGDEILLDTIDYSRGGRRCFWGGLRYDLALRSSYTGWICFIPLPNNKASTIRSALRRARRHWETLKVVSGGNAEELLKAGRAEGADALPGVPYRPQANRIERDIEMLSDRVRTQFVQSRLPPYLRPFISRYCSDIHNLFGVATFLDAQGQTCSASPFYHRFQRHPNVELSSIPHLGELVSVVKPKALTTSDDRTKPRGLPFLFLGLWSAHSTYDNSWIVLCLTTLLKEGKTRILRTRDVRRLPNASDAPKFPLRELADAYDASLARAAATALPDDQFIEAVYSLGGADESQVSWGDLAAQAFEPELQEADGDSSSSPFIEGADIIDADTIHTLLSECDDIEEPHHNNSSFKKTLP